MSNSFTLLNLESDFYNGIEKAVLTALRDIINDTPECASMTLQTVSQALNRLLGQSSFHAKLYTYVTNDDKIAEALRKRNEYLNAENETKRLLIKAAELGERVKSLTKEVEDLEKKADKFEKLFPDPRARQAAALFDYVMSHYDPAKDSEYTKQRYITAAGNIGGIYFGGKVSENNKTEENE